MPTLENKEESPEQNNCTHNELMARLIVRDVANEKSKTYECRVNVLQTYMQFFTPNIALQVKKHASVNNGKAHNTNWCVKLQVSCDLEIFDLVWRWMLNDLTNSPCSSHAPSSSPQNVITNTASPQYLPNRCIFTVENVVSVALCANFLHINKLLEQTLLYFREHVSEICLSNVNLSCIPGDLLGRISGYVKTAHLATTLQKMYENHTEHHPNRSFITSLLRHILIEELSHTNTQSCLLAIKAEQRNIKSCTEKEEREQEVEYKKEEKQEEEEEEMELRQKAALRNSNNNDSKCAYQWCTLCGLLFNKTAIELLTHQFEWLPPYCPALPSLYTDDKGHKLITHCTLAIHDNENKKRGIKTDALRWLKQCLCANQSAKYGKAKLNNNAQGVKKSAGDKEYENMLKMKKNMAMELFCWKLYGTITYVVCTSCNHLLPLIDTPNHFLQCAYNIHEPNAVVHECFIWPDGTIMQSVERQNELFALLDWYDFAEREGVYDAFTSSLEPLRCYYSSNNNNNTGSTYELTQGQQEMLNHERQYKGKENEQICGEWANKLELYAEVKKRVAMHQEHLLSNTKTALTYSWSKQTNHVLCHVLPMLCDLCSSGDDRQECAMENEHHSRHDHKHQQKNYYETKYNEQRKCNIVDQMMYHERNMQMTLTREMSKAQHFSFDALCHVDDQVDTHNDKKRLCSLKDNVICLVPSLPYNEMRHKSRKNCLHFVNNTRSNYTTSSSSASKAVISLAHRHRLNTL